MNRSKRLEPLKGIAQYREDHAAKAVMEVLETKNSAEQKLMELITYRRKYEQKLKLSYSQQGVSINHMQEAKLFMKKLNEAIRHQQHAIHSCVEELQGRLQEWKKSHIGNKNLEKLLARYQQVENKTEERRSQSEQDEQACNQYLRNRF